MTAKRHRKFILTIAWLLLAALLVGCTENSTVTTIKPTDTTTETSESVLTIKPAAASGTLRLWWPRRQTLNPLLDSSEAGMAANDLMYEGLFRISSYQQAEPLLAESLTTQIDGLTVTVKLTAGRTFDDGAPVTAADVKACIDFILAQPLASPYYAALSSVAAVSIIDDRTLALTLIQPDPWLKYALVFPVIPQQSLLADPLMPIPGTGPFRMVSYSAATGTSLVKKQPNGQIDELLNIQLLEFDSLAKAMQAYENDQIDLINLPPDDYSRYMLRSNLRFEQYTSRQLIFLAYNTKQNRPLADDNRMIFIKQQLTAEKIENAGISSWGEVAAVPLSAEAWLLAGSDADFDSSLKNLGEVAWTAAGSALVLLISADDRIQGQIAAIIGQVLSSAGISCQISALPTEEYRAALKAGQYDLTLLQAVMPIQPDPVWLYSDSRPAVFSVLSELALEGLADYDLWRQKLIASFAQLAAGSQPIPQEIADNLNETAARSPWSVLLIRSSAILYGDRVIGQCRPDRYHPYTGIEELWIWSGQ